MYLPKALLLNTITLGVKGGHNSIHSSYADLFLNQDSSDARRDWGQEEKGTTEDEMAGWHH